MRMMSTLRYPNRDPRKITCGMNSHAMERKSRVCKKLSRLMKMPSVICVTPMRMLIFIFSELRKGSSVLVPCQMGSNPNAYVPSWVRPVVYCVAHSPVAPVGSSGSHRHLDPPKTDIGTEKHSLYSRPV